MTPLRGRDLDPDPVGGNFERWYAAAGTDEMVVATIRPDGMPSSRMVLLKGHADGRFVFFTDQRSDKAVDILLNPNVSLLFRWPPARQVRVTGRATPVPRARDRPVLADTAAPVAALGLGFSSEPSAAQPCRTGTAGRRGAPGGSRAATFPARNGGVDSRWWPAASSFGSRGPIGSTTGSVMTGQ